MRQGKVVIFTAPGTPLQILTEPIPDPLPTELLVRVSLAGVCGSDTHRLSGDIPASPNPINFGHEGCGVIVALGSSLTADRAGTPIAPGDRIYWAPSTPCGVCSACESSNPMYCASLNWPPPAGTPNSAAYKQFATLTSKHIFYRVPDKTPLEAVIAFGCAMPTALRGFGKLGGVGKEVVIQGSGPVGLAATVLAKLGGAERIIVIGDPVNRLDAAQKLGATDTLSVSGTTAAERAERIKELTGGRGATTVIEAAGVAAAFPEGFNLLGMNGRYLIMGLYSGKAAAMIDPVRINNFNLQIIGSLGIEPENYWKNVEIASEHGERLGFANLITHRFGLDDIEEAIGTVGRLEAIKTVVTP
ncbi:5-exo-hydroxycamphor dehydrogenase [Lepidopterella palustris CBS 459.81]|uniref:5-exo-hydroxycamphor dehydrogenase n=1 Tax=Lepidopterella palustris CBS 459.81 TaxID=1314670 RepID=A0A8E2E7G6_9PEZI|nr:5-exo-hydroxycamphor dehydrogenase [Lepidopterella palustris CBS 459.81]